VCLVWIEFDDHEGLLTPDQLRDQVDLNLLAQRHGVSIYEVRPHP